MRCAFLRIVLYRCLSISWKKNVRKLYNYLIFLLIIYVFCAMVQLFITTHKNFIIDYNYTYI